MKFLIASDIHGSAFWCEKLLQAFDSEQAHKLVLLGDLLYHGPRNDFPDGYSPKKVFDMLNAVKDKIVCVRGNCDSEVDQMATATPWRRQASRSMLSKPVAATQMIPGEPQGASSAGS